MKLSRYLAVFCALIFGTGCARGGLATRPQPRAEPWWHREVAAQRARIGQGPYRIVFVGDSITAAWAGAGRRVWQELSSRFGPLLNLGIPGDRTEHLLWRLQRGDLARLSTPGPLQIVLLIGTNNLQRDDYREVARGIFATVRLLRRALPRAELLLMNILPRGPGPSTLRRRAWAASQLAHDLLRRERGIRFLDLGPRLLDGAGRLGRQLAPDYLHLSEQGYWRWAAALGVLFGAPGAGLRPPTSP